MSAPFVSAHIAQRDLPSAVKAEDGLKTVWLIPVTAAYQKPPNWDHRSLFAIIRADKPPKSCMISSVPRVPLGYLGLVLRSIKLGVGTGSIEWESDGMRPDGSASG